MSSTTLYLLGDQTGDVLSSIRELSNHAHLGSNISKFFCRVTDRLKATILQLPSEQRERFPIFQDPLDLATRFVPDSHHPAVSSALLSISQIGHAIV
jgi:hypothetical protein